MISALTPKIVLPNISPVRIPHVRHVVREIAVMELRTSGMLCGVRVRVRFRVTVMVRGRVRVRDRVMVMVRGRVRVSVMIMVRIRVRVRVRVTCGSVCVRTVNNFVWLHACDRVALHTW